MGSLRAPHLCYNVDMKKCSDCGLVKCVDQFSKRATSKDGFQSKCRSCFSKYRSTNKESLNKSRKTYRDKDREKWREWDRSKSRRYILKRYGLTERDYENLVHSQNGVCLICLLPPSDILVVDHCHVTGKVRGLLCRKCNAAIGSLNDDPILLERAINYLKM